MPQPLIGVLLPKQRWLYSFQSRDGSNEVLFPRGDHEWDSSQALRLASSAIISTSYSLDLLGHSLAPKDVSAEKLRYTVFGDPLEVDEELDAERSKMYEFGIAKLWSRDSADNFRWAWARLTDMPGISTGPKDNNIVPVSLSFVRYSDWYDADPIVQNEDIDTSPQTFIVSNGGSSQCTNIQLTITPNTSTGFNHPKITNMLTGEWFQIARDSVSVDDRIRLIMEEYRVEYSADGGVTYTSDYNNLSMGSVQVGLMRFIQGSNTLKYEDQGSPDLQLQLTYYNTYH